MKKLVYLTLFLLCSCTSVEFVRKDTSPTKQGILRHSVPSNEESAAKYRVKVNEEASKFCGGNFTITKEYQAREDSGSSAGVGTGFGIGAGSSIFIGGSDRRSSLYNFVEFTCH